MKKFSLNKLASDGNYYAIQEILIKQEWLERLRCELEENFTTSTFPVSFDFVHMMKENALREKTEMTPIVATCIKIVNDMCVDEGKLISRLHKGMRTLFVSTGKCEDVNKVSYVIRSGPKKDALVCPWCIKEKRENYRECFTFGPFWLFGTIFTKIETTKGLRFLYVHRCSYNKKLFIVERPDSRFLESEFYERCPYCEAGKDKFGKIVHHEGNMLYFCLTCKSVFSVGSNPKRKIWEEEQSKRVLSGIKSEWLESKLYDFRPLDIDHY